MQEFSEYTQKAMLFRKHDGLFWASIGLASEAGEVCGEVKKWFEKEGESLTPERREQLVLELGDVLWFLTAVCDEIGVPLQTVAGKNIDKLAKRYLQPKGTA